MANQGFGCMGLSGAYASFVETTPEVAKQIVHHAVEKGVTLFNSSTFYGVLNEVGFGGNPRILRKAIEGLDRSKIQLMVKICLDTRVPVEKTGTKMELRASTEDIARDIDYALEQLGTDYIDIIVMCRVPQDRPIEDVVLDMKKAVDAGKARHIGLSEASASTIRRANAVVPIYCIEQEWSLWSRDIEQEIVPACRELGIKIVAYSPLGRGFLTGAFQAIDNLDANDFRRKTPKFAEGNFQHNIALVNAVQAIADRKGITVGQLALAWLHAQGPDVIPIPGTTKPAHFDQNYAALQVKLSAADLAEIEEVFKVDAVVGDRYPGNHMTFHKNA